MRKFMVTVHHTTRPKSKHGIYAIDSNDARTIVSNYFSLTGELVRHIEVEVTEVAE